MQLVNESVVFFAKSFQMVYIIQRITNI